MFDLEEIERREKEWDEQLKKNIFIENTSDESYEDEEDENFDSSMTQYEFHVSERLHNARIDAILADFMPDLSRSQCASLVDDGCVSILHDTSTTSNSTRILRKSERVEQGNIIQVLYAQRSTPLEIKAQNIPLDVLFEDEHMIVINKEAGMVVHPAVGNWDGTIVNALAYYLAHKSPFGPGEFLPNINSLSDEPDEEGEVTTFRPGIVHRLDKGTSGILVVAKTHQALATLSSFFARRQVQKTYLAITVGNPGTAMIDKPIGRHPLNRQKMRVVPEPTRRVARKMVPSPLVSKKGRKALSHVQSLAYDSKLSLVQVRIETGRTHQIRVHLQDRKTPIYGDDIYGIPDWNKKLAKSYDIHRPLLHAHKLEICHPVNGEKMVFQAPMPQDMSCVAQAIWNEGKLIRPELFFDTIIP